MRGQDVENIYKTAKMIYIVLNILVFNVILYWTQDTFFFRLI